MKLSAFFELFRVPSRGESLIPVNDTPMILVEFDRVGLGPEPTWLRSRISTLTCVVVGLARNTISESARPFLELFDIVLCTPGDAEPQDGVVGVEDVDDSAKQLAKRVSDHPLAAVTLAMLLRMSDSLPLEAALAAESAAYSALQAGPEFAAWLATRPAPERAESTEPAVIAERDEDTLYVTLNSPKTHNAYSLQMRDELCEYLTLVDSDSSITRLIIEGAGQSFCSGGHLSEFGMLPDPATAHIVRMSRSAGKILSRMGERVEVRIHGAAIGSGIELAAFAGRITADPSAQLSLPELKMGLIPGSGGTASLRKRIGRQRTGYLALTGSAIDASTALEWGLVDAIIPRDAWGAQ